MSTKIKRKTMRVTLLSKRAIAKIEAENLSNVGCNDAMIAMGGRTVTVFLDTFDEDDSTFSIKEDGNAWTWEPMFLEPKSRKRLSKYSGVFLSLPESIQGHNRAKVNTDGSIRIGCTTVRFETIEKLYRAAKKAA